MSPNNQEYKDAIVALISVLNPEVVKLINDHLGTVRATQAKAAISLGETALRGEGNGEGVDLHTGFLEVGDQRISVDFASPSYMNSDEKDAIFLKTLALQVSIGHSVTKTIAGL